MKKTKIIYTIPNFDTAVIVKESEFNTQVFNLGTEVESTTQQGIDWVEQLTGKKINVVVVPRKCRGLVANASGN